MAKIAVPHFEMNHLITLIIEMFNKTIQNVQEKIITKSFTMLFKFTNLS